MQRSRWIRWTPLTACLLATVVLAGCAATRHSTHVEHSGFLGQGLYDKMKPGDESKLEPSMTYREDRDFTHYTKVILDPVVLYRQPHEQGGGNSNTDAQELINYFYNKIYMELSKIVEVVDKPGPNTFRLSFAVTDYEQSWVALDMISTIVPQLRVVSELKGVATGKPSFVGGAQIEFKGSDSMTGAILAAGIDRRVGGKTLGKGTDSWADVRNIMDFWSKGIAYRVCVVGKKPNCVKPEA